MIKLFIAALLLSVTALLIAFTTGRQNADIIIYNAKVYTVDSRFTVTEAVVVKGGKLEAVGKSKDLLARYDAAQKIDAKGKPVYPGLIDAHCHFYRYGLGLATADLVGTASWEDVLKRLQAHRQKDSEGWLIGRGWDQNDWPVQEFPTNAELNRLFPDVPVFLTRVDGHAAIANDKALALAGVQAGHRLTGGEVETKEGKLTGILIDNAVDLVSEKIPAPTLAQIKGAVTQAQNNCFAVGLTSVVDCGLDYGSVLRIDSFQKRGELKMRVYAMLSDAPYNYNFLFSRGKIKTPYLHVRSFKVYADGALGSRGACLLQPYTDKPDWRGFLLSSVSHFDSVANIIRQHGFQMCTHAIGDSGNRAVLNIYAKYLKGKNDQRWRIEHAQVVNKQDFSLFNRYSIIPSVQPTHATSDMYWAGERLGKEREKGAYAFKKLLDQNGWIPLGTDFPVEDISPFKTFYAAVVRQDEKGYPAGGYQVENALTRKEALQGMTIWAARGNFEEGEKGSLEKGKWADLVILDRDIITAAPKDILNTKVLATFVGGEKVFEGR